MQIQVRRNVRGFAFGLVAALLAGGILAAGGGVVQAVQVAGSGGGGSDEGLVAEWRFDEGAGSVLHDSSGNGNDGVIHGATWTEGKFGNALRFDGQDDFVEVPHSSSLNLGKYFTITTWIKPTTLSTDNQLILGKGSWCPDGAPTFKGFSYAFFIGADYQGAYKSSENANKLALHINKGGNFYHEILRGRR
ncbi:MAG: hypothetical protein C4B55_02845 [Candidatus Methanophagaceae archaeon]|nr:MAG: hypothetical protein C4B55_02845 [Methanophagales archaeon]